ncbi:ribonuclease domain-containing protein [Undibacterium fentianense]|uniref:Ribonuclease n=1 Tax=Undibacterium fentianense TaxID=2828728 RepID=A0A941E245_9BURK|nr:ribonuclease domain-containing protein [Undibacterium fentianense]MBR7799986.1 ribonuclease [Undibacterium fentianense]
MKSLFKKFWLTVLLSLSLVFPVFSQDEAFVRVQELPREAQQTLRMIRQGGPFPYEKDGSVFGNYERQLPKRPRGYYREYTVKTPYARNRGARRIVAGGAYPNFAEFFYTDDHYASFRKIRE